MGHASVVTSLRSALVRPLDRQYPTNLAVMILAPGAGMVLGVLSYRQSPQAMHAATTAGRGALAVFSGWALAREIAPDDNPAAFISMTLVLLTLIFVPSASLLPVFTAIMLARILNRSVGVPANLLDSIAVTLLAVWAAYSAGHPGPALVAGAGFCLDALLVAPQRRQLFFAAVCVGGAGLGLIGSLRPSQVSAVPFTLPVIIIALGYLMVILLTRTVRSVADLTGKPLDVNRVRAAMAVVWLMGVQGALSGSIASSQSIIIWAVLAGVLIMTIVRPRMTGLVPLILMSAVACSRSASQGLAPATSLVDTLVNVGDHRLHFKVWPSSSKLTLVFEAGGGAALTSWESVPQAAAREFSQRVAAYDRAGLGSSEVGPMELVPGQESLDLFQALDRLGASRIVLIGHSYGGLLSMLHAIRNPARVAGLVLVDPMNTDFIQRVSLAWLNTTAPDIPNPASASDTVIVRMKRTIGDLVAATQTGIASLEMPMVVLTAGVPFWGNPERDAAWRASHETIAGMKPNRRLLVATQSRHGIPGSEPARVIDAIRLLLTLIPEND